jgi:threonine synthase
MELGKEVMSAASTGNAASSLAGLAASVGLKCIIFVPKTAPQGKIAQLLIYGATVLAVDGTYDQAFDLCLEASKEYGWYIRNTAYNPYLSEGKKTACLRDMRAIGLESPRLDFGRGWRWVHNRRIGERAKGPRFAGLD